MRLTVGPLPASVYWRRRAIVLAGALLVVFLIAQACMGASGDGAPDGSGSPGASTGAGSPGPGGSPGPTGTPGAGTSPVSSAAAESGSPTAPADDPAAEIPEGEECTDEEIRVTAQAERTRFTPGDPVRLTILIGNDSERTCWRDIGGDLRELSLVRGTGADRVWSSRDCGPPEGSDVRQLPPGFETSYFLVWNGRASDSCDGDVPDGEFLPAGTYQLFARLDDVHSPAVTLELG